MEDKKDPTLEQLIEIAKTPIKLKEDTTSHLSEAHRFAVHYNIQPGEYRVRAAVVYELYRHWKNNKKLQTTTKFFTHFGKIFEKYKDNYYSYYLLDPTPFNLTNEIYEGIDNAISKKGVDKRTLKGKHHGKKETT